MFGQQNYSAYQQPIYSPIGFGQMNQPMYRTEGQGMSNYCNQGTVNTANGQTLIWLSGEQAAWDYLVAPNNAVHIRDTTQPRLYVKRADSSGKPSLQIFDLVERTTQQNAPTTQQNTPTTAPAQAQSSVTRDEVDAIRREVETLKGQIEKLTSPNTEEGTHE